MYDPEPVKVSKRRIGKLFKAQWDEIKLEGDQVTHQLVGLMDRPVGDPKVRALIAQHRDWIEQFYTANADVYRGLGQLYATHPELRATYEKYAPYLADFLQAVMVYYANHTASDRRP